MPDPMTPTQPSGEYENFRTWWVTWTDDNGPVESGPFYERYEAEERAAIFGGVVEGRV